MFAKLLHSNFLCLLTVQLRLCKHRNVVLMQQDAVDINDRLIKTIQHAFEKFLPDGKVDGLYIYRVF